MDATLKEKAGGGSVGAGGFFFTGPVSLLDSSDGFGGSISGVEDMVEWF